MHIHAAFCALEDRIQVDDVFGCIRQLCGDPALQAVPLVGMLSYSLVYRRGPEKFLDQSQAAGLTLHVRLVEGRDTQHVLEAIFKALGVALAQACRPRGKEDG